MQTRSQSRLNGSGLSIENSVSTAGNGSSDTIREESTEETSSPAQMAAMAALRRANQQRTPSRSKANATAVPNSAGGALPILQDEIAGAFEYRNKDRETSDSRNDSSRKKINAQLIPLFVDPVQATQLEGNVPVPSSPLSPRSVIASIRWGVDQLRRSQRTGEEEEWRSEVDRLREAHADLGTAITDLAQADDAQ